MRRLWWLPALALVACDATDVTDSDGAPPVVDAGADEFVPPPDPDMNVGAPQGAPCGSPSDCQSGYCVPTPDGDAVCSIACVEGEANACPDGYYCINRVEYGTSVCLPAERLPLCEPCTDDQQCGGPRDLCLPLLNGGGAKACARDCSTNDCPAGLSCEQIGDGRQCIPLDGICPDVIEDDDRDGDGVPDDDDACPDEFGTGLDGCPIPDRDGDGVPDDEDACPDVFGSNPDGCPPPMLEDRDRDGVPDDEDACPDRAGGLPNGCPVGSINGQIVSAAGPFDLFVGGFEGLLGGFDNQTPMASPSYRIQPISIGVKP